jgi:nonsense-mediated mRNA decay protein 3
MSFKKFCPKCGKKADSLVKNICVDCFLKNNSLFEVGKVSIKICKFCGKLFLSGKEFIFDEELIAQEIASKTKIIPQLQDPKIFVELIKKSDVDFEALVKVKGFINDFLVERQKSINFQLKEITCDSCMKLNSDYREAILQIRSDNKRDVKAMFNLVNDLLKKESFKDSLSGTSKIIELKNGYDFWIGSKKSAAKIVKYLGDIYKVKPKVSKKLIGQEKSGKRKYRFTFCIRLE